MSNSNLNIGQFAEDIVNTIAESLLVLDAGYRVVFANNSFYEMFKLKPKDAEEKIVFEMNNGEWNIPQLKVLLEEVLPKRKSFEHFVVDYEFSNIGRKIMELSGRKVVNLENGDSLILLTIEDFTEYKRFEEYTLQASRLKALGELSAGMSHGLSSPLTGIQNILYVYFQESVKGSEKYKELKMMLQSCDYMGEIIKNITLFAGRGQEQFDELHLKEVVNSALMLIERQLVANNIEIENDIPDDFGVINGKKFELQHVILNILLNAKEAISEKGKIVIKGVRDGKTAILSISDDGKGILKKDLPNIFNPFFTTKREFGGVGLGLSAAYGIIKNHNGEIYAESGEKGTTIFIKLNVL